MQRQDEMKVELIWGALARKEGAGLAKELMAMQRGRWECEGNMKWRSK